MVGQGGTHAYVYMYYTHNIKKSIVLRKTLVITEGILRLYNTHT